MHQAHRSRKLATVAASRGCRLLLLLGAVVLSGCQPIMMLGYLIGGPPMTEPDFHRKTKKESLSTKGKITLVYCYAPKELKWDNESVDYDLAKHVAYQLNNNKIKVVDPDRVYAWLDKNSRWNKPSEIGAAFKADYIVHIDLMDYSLFEANAQFLYRGRADCVVNVIKMDSDYKDGTVIYTHPIKSNFPINGPVDNNSMPFNEFKKRYLSFLSDQVGRLFYPTETGNDIPNGMLHQ
ncbi:MAG: hypothetical protein JSS02_24775 [Planctomycetes bacterium]|nr:hypothetical protein [Planctomycetota bacterium]